jgi:4-hydroxybenzoate polyprenyltransferase
MVSMKDFLNLIRWKNLVIVIMTMVLMRYAVIEPLLGKIGVFLKNGPVDAVPMELRFPWYYFVLLVAATVFLTAGGYVINDYFDIRTDLINRGKVIVGTKISRRKAMMWHTILNISGVGAGFFISWKAGYVWMGTLFLIVSGLLYFYSASYKRQFLIGNVIVAILTALVPMLVVFYEWPALYRHYLINAVSMPEFDLILYWVGGFSLFAFMTTMIREIIKDIEDFEGDIAYGRNTIPVVLGIFNAKMLSGSLIIITIIILYIIWYFYINDLITLVYISATIAIPLILALKRLIKSQDKKQLHSTSNMMKFVMLTGILYSVLVKVILTWNLY